MAKKLREWRRVGWIGKTAPVFQRVLEMQDDDATGVFISTRKGKEGDWFHEWWPPRKVEVIVRELPTKGAK